jgi:hypothetical protein
VHTNHSVASRELAEVVQRETLRVTGYRDRGVKPMGLGVLNPSSHDRRTAACLVEISFMTVPAEEARMRTAAYVDALGKALATAALAYLAAHQTVVSAIDATYASAKLAATAPASPGRRGKRGRKARAAVSHECAAYVKTKTSDEATAWGAQSAVALAAFAFWERFLGLGVQTGPGKPVPTREISGDERTRLLTILRAVSWVESRHGTGAGRSAAVDPMQCAHPQDAWWREITAQVAQFSYFDRNLGLKDVYSRALPGEAEAATGWPNGVRLDVLDDPLNGHRDAHFDARFSYYWGVPWLIHRINRHPVHLCKDFSRKALIKGAVSYNGGGDANYSTKIEDALELIGGL